MQALANTPLTQLKGVGSKVAEKLHKLNIETVQDLLFHLPLRYEDRTRICPIKDALPGMHVSVSGEVKSCDVQFGRKRMLVVRINDPSGSLILRFFHFSAAQKNNLSEGTQIQCFGEVRRGKHGLEMMHPEYKAIKQGVTQTVSDVLTPVYPTTDGLRQASLRQLTEQALKYLEKGALAELLPEGLYPTQISLKDALILVHRPPAEVSLDTLEEAEHPAQQRLIMEELLAHHLSVLKSRQHSIQLAAASVTIDRKAINTFIKGLPFTPTQAQLRVTEDIYQDISAKTPMMRLVQGDVGSGKTLVAALAALAVIKQGYQVALMAPTELLAEQHASGFESWLSPMDIKVGWLAGKLTGKKRREALEQIKSGDIQMLVGTHAVFQEQVEYDNLALIIVDEQHRFGVHQRLALREKGEKDGQHPHQLIMTATPIPRTLAMTAYADLDTSIIDELPPGRTPVTTAAIPDLRREQVLERVHNACKNENRQVYWVCTLIEESDVLQAQAAEDACIVIKTALPDLKVGLVHGRLKGPEKQQIMDEFKQGELDVLVATTVIEVGVDVPNASLMIIENPERLGLAQLHQLRGRVGRGSVESHCVLMYQSPLSKTAQKRLGVLRQTNDGFIIAQEDLEIRGPGEFLGTKQTGLADMRIADLMRDQALIPQVHSIAEHLWQQYPSFAQAIINRWLGSREHYGQA
jgi:ATP-dependent DNA helicase RecG